jgi:cytochrome c biogenesis protein CcmG, thiol:disulfide interchange protein DsbE
MRPTLLIGLGLSLCASMSFGQEVETFRNKPMIPFKMTTFQGKTLTNASLKGKVVILDFWATWCGPCKLASPTMQAIHQKYAAKGVVVIGANTEGSKTGKKAMAYPGEHKYTYTFTKDNDALSGKLGISGIPCFMFIDKKGIVRSVFTGFDPSASPADFDAVIQKLLKS